MNVEGETIGRGRGGWRGGKLGGGGRGRWGEGPQGLTRIHTKTPGRVPTWGPGRPICHRRVNIFKIARLQLNNIKGFRLNDRAVATSEVIWGIVSRFQRFQALL